MKALVIDDSSAMRQILEQIMNDLSFEVYQAKDGRDGLRQLKEHDDIDVVLVDWNMPDINGIEFVEVVRARPVHQELPIVMVTTEMEPSSMLKAMVAGVDEFVTKPFEAATLVEKLKRIGVKASAVS